VTGRHLLVFLGLGVLACVVGGCKEIEYPESFRYEFRPHPYKDAANNRQEITLDDEMAGQLSQALESFFGTPRNPTIRFEWSEETSQTAKNERDLLSDDNLRQGSALYRQHCLHCHGMMGDGNGPTGQFLNPKPRDFRTGLFKFRSTVKKSGDQIDTSMVQVAPSRADLLKTLRHGIPTASMPAFNLLTQKQLDQLVSYVIHLSLRGQVELFFAKKKEVPGESDVAEQVQKVTKRWLADAVSPLVPKRPSKPWDQLHAEGRATNWSAGRQIFLGDGACVQCHGKDGQASEIELPDNKTRKNEWGDPIQPRNLTLGFYRGGSRPIDIFYRIKLGISGSGMPAASDKLSDDQLWQLVDYVLSMPQQLR
jgi:mono/diheme cytochrome c family protein